MVPTRIDDYPQAVAELPGWRVEYKGE
jgi:hypothetical protein